MGEIDECWWRVLTAKLAGGLIGLGCGLSLGREGPSIQLGAMAAKGFSRLTKRVKTEEKLLMTCGATAGLSAAFNAPIAGVLFSLEEIHKHFSPEILLVLHGGFNYIGLCFQKCIWPETGLHVQHYSYDAAEHLRSCADSGRDHRTDGGGLQHLSLEIPGPVSEDSGTDAPAADPVYDGRSVRISLSVRSGEAAILWWRCFPPGKW